MQVKFLMEFWNKKDNICKILKKKNKIPQTSLGHVALRCFQVETAVMYAQQFGHIKNIKLWLCHQKVLILACHIIDTISFQYMYKYLFHVWRTNYLIDLHKNISLRQCCCNTFSCKKNQRLASSSYYTSIFEKAQTILMLP